MFDMNDKEHNGGGGEDKHNPSNLGYAAIAVLDRFQEAVLHLSVCEDCTLINATALIFMHYNKDHPEKEERAKAFLEALELSLAVNIAHYQDMHGDKDAPSH